MGGTGVIETKLPGACSLCGERVYWVSNAWRVGAAGWFAPHVCSGSGNVGAENGGRVAQTTDPQATPDCPEATVRDDTRPASAR